MKQADILALIHESNPYEGFDANHYTLDMQGWLSFPSVFDRLIATHKPQVVIEVGTWKGASAFHIAKRLLQEKISATVICVDTWLGAQEFWYVRKGDDRTRSLLLRHGYPQVYYQFLANVILKSLQNIIVPFPVSSVVGAAVLEKHGITADMIYIDGSHEELDVYADASAYWKLLKPGGVMFGDDYLRGWPGVMLGVHRFCFEHGIRPTGKRDKWVLVKPS